MNKLKLFFAAATLLCAGQTWAQTDVTSTYLTNADFSTGTPIDNNVCTYGKDMTNNNTTYYGAQAIDGWTNASVGSTSDGYDNCTLAGAIFTYGSTPWIGGSGTPAPATDPDGNAGNAAGLCAVWGGTICYTQNVTLPAGSYTIRFKTYNSTNNNGSGKFIATNLFGFVANNGTNYYAPSKTFAIGQWSTIAVTFNLIEETAGKISMGYAAASSGNADMPHLFVDNVKILKNTYYEDVTNKVGIAQASWTGSGDGIKGSVTTDDGRTTGLAANYGTVTAGTVISQTVTGLKKGTYEAELFAYSQDEWKGNLTHDAGDVAYVMAEGTHTIKEWINARKGDHNADVNGIYSLSGIEVSDDGKLTLGFALAKDNQSEWHAVQIKSLKYTKNLDFSDLVSAYNSALEAAKAVDQSKAMAASIKTALNNAIETYDTGKVDLEDADAMEAATDALIAVTTNAKNSIASYAVIAAGTIPDNSLDGWVCENTNTFHINTWSVEGNSGNDPSGMVTPFIENWVAKGSYLGAGKVYYKLEGLEPGEVYYAQALVRSYNEASSDAPNGPNFFINDVVTSLSTAGTTFTYNNMSGIYATLGGAAAIGSDGTLTLGIEIASGCNYNWVAFKNVSIQSMDDAFDAAVAKVTALEGTIPTAAYNKALAEVTTYSGENYPTTAAGFETAIAAIEAAAATAAKCVEPYAAYGKLKNDVQALYDVTAYEELTSGSHDELDTAISTAETNIVDAEDVAGINSVITTLKAAGATYAGAANPTGEGKFNLTFMMTNPDLSGFTSWTKVENVDGWYTEQNIEGQNAQVMKNDGVACSKGNAFFEYWSETAAANNEFALYNKVNLPEGTFTINCYALATANNVEGATNSAVYFYANDTQGSLVAADVLTEQSISFVNTTTQDVKIGLKTLTGNEFRWMGIGYVELYKVPAQTYTVDETTAWDNTQSGAGAVTLNRTIKEGVNTLVLPFSMTQNEVESNFGTGSKVYTVSAYDATKENISFTSKEGISANEPCLLKATAAGTSYSLENRTIVAGNPVKTGTNVTMTGSYAASVTVPTGSYIISGDKLYSVNSEVTMKNTRAYITLTTETAGARVLGMVFDGETTTGIVTMENGKLNMEEGTVYDLSGRKVTTLNKGVYVVNGKKVIK